MFVSDPDPRGQLIIDPDGSESVSYLDIFVAVEKYMLPNIKTLNIIKCF